MLSNFFHVLIYFDLLSVIKKKIKTLLLIERMCAAHSNKNIHK